MLRQQALMCDPSAAAASGLQTHWSSRHQRCRSHLFPRKARQPELRLGLGRRLSTEVCSFGFICKSYVDVAHNPVVAGSNLNVLGIRDPILIIRLGFRLQCHMSGFILHRTISQVTIYCKRYSSKLLHITSVLHYRKECLCIAFRQNF